MKLEKGYGRVPKLKFVHGCMMSGKSMDLIKVYTNYKKTGRDCIILTPDTDTRGGTATVKSRLGDGLEAIPVSPKEDLYDLVARNSINPVLEPACVLVDEAQFLTRQQVIDLTHIVDMLHIPVIAYGLKNTFKNTLFEGSEALILLADEITEVKTVCQYCNKKATMNLLCKNGKPVFSGDDVFIGNLEFSPVCREHYYKIKNGLFDPKKGKEIND